MRRARCDRPRGVHRGPERLASSGSSRLPPLGTRRRRCLRLPGLSHKRSLPWNRSARTSPCCPPTRMSRSALWTEPAGGSGDDREVDRRHFLVFADAVFNMPHLPGLQGFVLRYITGSSGGPRVSRVARLFMIKNKAAFAAHLERLATDDLRRVIVAHHQTITDDPAGMLRRVAASLG